MELWNKCMVMVAKFLALPMKIKQLFQKKLYHTSLNGQEAKYFETIDEMPIILWDKLCNENDLKYLLKSGELDDRAVSIYENIYDQIIKNFGISEKYKQILRLQIKIESLWHDVLVNGNKWKELQANIEEDNLDKLLKLKVDKIDIYESLFSIEKNLNFSIDYDKISIRKYYNYCINIEKTAKRYEKIKLNNK